MLFTDATTHSALCAAIVFDASQVESFWLSDTLTVPPVAASSKAGSTCASAGHSRTSSIQGLPFAAVSGQEGLGLDAGAAGDEAGSSASGTSMLDPFAATLDVVQEGGSGLSNSHHQVQQSKLWLPVGANKRRHGQQGTSLGN